MFQASEAVSLRPIVLNCPSVAHCAHQPIVVLLGVGSVAVKNAVNGTLSSRLLASSSHCEWRWRALTSDLRLGSVLKIVELEHR